MEKDDNSKTIGEIDPKEKEFRNEIYGCIIMLFIAVFISLIIIPETRWIPVKTYLAIVLFVLILPLLENFVKEKLIWLFITRIIANFSVAVMLALPAMVSYTEQTQYPLFYWLGCFILIYFIYRSIDRIRRINYEKLAQFLAKHKAIKPRKGTIALWNIPKDNLPLIINPLTGFNFINKSIEKFYRDYLIVASMIFFVGGGAWGIILDRTVGFKIAAYVIAIMPYHCAFCFLDRAQLNYALVLFLHKKQKELGKKLIIV